MTTGSKAGSDRLRAWPFKSILWMASVLVAAAVFGADASAATVGYVTNELDGTVSVIDTSTNAVVTTITVGSAPLGVAVTPDGTHA